jgi:hypothetical protein
MARWSIGNLVFDIPLTGQFQPEEFNESISAQFNEMPNIGGVFAMTLKGWKPREITISFIVDALNTGAPEERIDPEYIWNVILNMVQPPKTGGMGRLVFGDLVPNTGGPYRNKPNYASLTLPGWENVSVVITNASFKRTHIGRDGRAVRGTISLTLKQVANPQAQAAEVARRAAAAAQGVSSAALGGGAFGEGTIPTV